MTEDKMNGPFARIRDGREKRKISVEDLWK